MYGWRGRVGLVVPTGNTTMEPELARMAPEGVSVHANRIRLRDVTPESLLDMEHDARESALGLVQCEVGVLAFGCTSGSFVGGRDHHTRITRAMEDATGIPATTTSSAVLRALETIGARRVAMATPYVDEINRIEKRFLEDHGFDVVRMAGGGITETARIQDCEPHVAYRRAREIDDERADAIFVSCTGFRTIEIIERLEADCAKPVVTANQATFADCLRILGVREAPIGFGSLFERVARAPAAADASALRPVAGASSG